MPSLGFLSALSGGAQGVNQTLQLRLQEAIRQADIDRQFKEQRDRDDRADRQRATEIKGDQTFRTQLEEASFGRDLLANTNPRLIERFARQNNIPIEEISNDQRVLLKQKSDQRDLNQEKAREREAELDAYVMRLSESGKLPQGPINRWQSSKAGKTRREKSRIDKAFQSILPSLVAESTAEDEAREIARDEAASGISQARLGIAERSLELQEEAAKENALIKKARGEKERDERIRQRAQDHFRPAFEDYKIRVASDPDAVLPDFGRYVEASKTAAQTGQSMSELLGEGGGPGGGIFDHVDLSGFNDSDRQEFIDMVNELTEKDGAASVEEMLRQAGLWR